MGLTRGRIAGWIAAAKAPRTARRSAYLRAVSREAQRSFEMGRMADAQQCCLFVLARDETQPESLRCLAKVVAQRDEWQKVLHCAAMLERAGDLDSADEAFALAHDVAPGETQPLVRRGLLFQRRGRNMDALDCFRRTLALDPVYPIAHVQSALIHLSMGSFRLGWAEFEWRLRMPRYDSLRAVPKPLWRGEALAQRAILVQSEPRAEDTRAFANYLPMLADRGARVIFSGPYDARSALEGVRGIELMIDSANATDAATLEAVDWRCPIGSLPLWLGPDADAIPLDLPGERLLNEW